MSRFKPSDEELLSYWMDDLSTDKKEEVEKWLQESPENKKEWLRLNFLFNEIQSAPLVFQKKKWREVFAIVLLRLSFVFGAFLAGLIIQRDWKPIYQSQESPSHSEAFSLEVSTREPVL